MIVPDLGTGAHAPVVVTAKLNGLPTSEVGVPLIVNNPPLKLPVTPAGNVPVKVAPVALPPIV